MTNRFSLLEVEDCEDFDEIFTHLQAQGRSTGSKTSQPKTPGTDKPPKDDPVDTDDICMRLFCFFEDVHMLRRQVGDTWKSYKLEQTDLITATTTTNAAMLDWRPAV